MGFAEKLNMKYDNRAQAEQDSLIALENQHIQNYNDSLNIEQIKRDTTAAIVDNKVKQKKEDDLIIDQSLKHFHFTQQRFDGKPRTTAFLDDEYLNGLDNAIHAANVRKITHEANTSVTQEYNTFQNYVMDNERIHMPYRVELSTQLGPGGESYINPVNPTDSKYWGANSYDRIWYSGDPRKDIQERTNIPDPGDPEYAKITASRSVMQHPDIVRILDGEYGYDENNILVKKTDGLIDFMYNNGIGKEARIWINLKERFGSRAEVLNIIDTAVEAKKKGQDYFTSAWSGDWMGLNRKRAAKESWSDSLEGKTEEEIKLILSIMQNHVNEIVNIGLAVEAETAIFTDKYIKAYNEFPEREGPYTREETPFKNKDLMKTKELDNDLGSLMQTYKYTTGKDYNIDQSYNRVANDSLGYRLEDLPDVEKTLGGEQMMILLSEELRVNREREKHNPDMAFDQFKQMYNAYGPPKDSTR